MAVEAELSLRKALEGSSPRRVHVEGAREAAVLIGVISEPEPTLIFTRRTETLSSHKGQISFPGGSIDHGDESPIAAALRETEEELGLDPTLVKVLGELDETPTFVSGYTVTPVVGWIDSRPTLTPNPAEVADVLLVPVAALNEDSRHEPGFSYQGRTFPTEAWIVDGEVIWGLTARLVRLFLYALADAGLADAPPPTASPWPEPSGAIR
jgi:8-oxo-dGTP pyrophosphatase MutT (NUDIX family)